MPTAIVIYRFASSRLFEQNYLSIESTNNYITKAIHLKNSNLWSDEFQKHKTPIHVVSHFGKCSIFSCNLTMYTFVNYSKSYMYHSYNLSIHPGMALL